MLNQKIIAKLLRFAKRKLDEKLKEKLSQEEAIKIIESKINDLAWEVENEKKVADNNFELSVAFSSYYTRAKKKMVELANEITMAHLKLDEIADELKAINIDISKYKKLSENIDKKEVIIAEQQEAKKSDEFNINKLYQ